MSEIKDIISDKEVEYVHANANYGNKDKREVVNEALLKHVCEYKNGFTSDQIIKEHGLITSSGKITEKGRRYLWEVYHRKLQPIDKGELASKANRNVLAAKKIISDRAEAKETAVTFYMLRLKCRPDLYVGKKNPTYAVKTDQRITANIQWYLEQRNEVLVARNVLLQRDESNPPYWFVPKTRAKVWSGVTGVRRFIGRCRSEATDTFSEYEIEETHPKSGVAVMPLDELLQNREAKETK